MYSIPDLSAECSLNLILFALVRGKLKPLYLSTVFLDPKYRMPIVGSGLALDLFYFLPPLFRRTIIILRLVFTVSLYLPCNVQISSSENTRHVSTARRRKHLVGSGKIARQLETNPTYFVIKRKRRPYECRATLWGG